MNLWRSALTTLYVAAGFVLVAAGTAGAVSVDVSLTNPHLVTYPGSGELVYRLSLTAAESPENVSIAVTNGDLASIDYTQPNSWHTEGPGIVTFESTAVPSPPSCDPSRSHHAPTISTFDARLPASTTTSVFLTFKYTGKHVPWQGARYAPKFDVRDERTGSAIHEIVAPEPQAETTTLRPLVYFVSRPNVESCRGRRVRRGTRVRLRGWTVPAVPGQRIDLEVWYQLLGSRLQPKTYKAPSFKRRGSARTDANGNFVLTFTLRRSGTYTLRPKYGSQQPDLADAIGGSVTYLVGR